MKKNYQHLQHDFHPLQVNFNESFGILMNKGFQPYQNGKQAVNTLKKLMSSTHGLWMLNNQAANDYTQNGQIINQNIKKLMNFSSSNTEAYHLTSRWFQNLGLYRQILKDQKQTLAEQRLNERLNERIKQAQEQLEKRLEDSSKIKVDQQVQNYKTQYESQMVSFWNQSWEARDSNVKKQFNQKVSEIKSQYDQELAEEKRKYNIQLQNNTLKAKAILQSEVQVYKKKVAVKENEIKQAKNEVRMKEQQHKFSIQSLKKKHENEQKQLTGKLQQKALEIQKQKQQNQDLKSRVNTEIYRVKHQYEQTKARQVEIKALKQNLKQSETKYNNMSSQNEQLIEKLKENEKLRQSYQSQIQYKNRQQMMRLTTQYALQKQKSQRKLSSVENQNSKQKIKLGYYNFLISIIKKYLLISSQHHKINSQIMDSILKGLSSLAGGEAIQSQLTSLITTCINATQEVMGQTKIAEQIKESFNEDVKELDHQQISFNFYQKLDAVCDKHLARFQVIQQQLNKTIQAVHEKLMDQTPQVRAYQEPIIDQLIHVEQATRNMIIAQTNQITHLAQQLHHHESISSVLNQIDKETYEQVQKEPQKEGQQAFQQGNSNGYMFQQQNAQDDQFQDIPMEKPAVTERKRGKTDAQRLQDDIDEMMKYI